MKTISIFVILIFSFSLVTSLSTNMKTVYQPGETLIAEIQGEILSPIEMENIELKRKNVQVPFEYSVEKLNERFFIIGILPSTMNNYTLHINDIFTTVNGKPKEINFQQNFSISGDFVPYTISPGLLETKDEVFSVEIFSNLDVQQTISTNFPEEEEIIIYPGKNTLNFNFAGSDVQYGFYYIQVGIYSLPVYLISTYVPPEVAVLELRFFPTVIESTILIDEEKEYPFAIYNPTLTELQDLSLEFNDELLVIDPDKISSIESNGSITFSLRPRKKNNPIDEIITIRSKNSTFTLPVRISYTESEEEVETPYLDEESEESRKFYCIQLDGTECSSSELCDGETVSTSDVSSCCIGACSPISEEDEGGSLAWIGYLIIAIILIVLVILGGRYWKARKSKQEPLKKRIKKAEAKNPKIIPPHSYSQKK